MRVLQTPLSSCSVQVTPSSVRLCPLDALLHAERPKSRSPPGGSSDIKISVHANAGQHKDTGSMLLCDMQRCQGQKGFS